MKFCDIRATVLLQSYVIMPGGRLPETENKRICQISGPKSGRGRLRNLRSGRLRESFWNSVWNKQNGYLKSGRLREVVAYEKWSLSWLGKRKIVVRELVMRHLPPLAPALIIVFENIRFRSSTCKRKAGVLKTLHSGA